MVDDNLFIEGFASWVLATQLAAGVLPQPTPVVNPATAVTQQVSYPAPVETALDILERAGVLDRADFQISIDNRLQQALPMGKFFGKGSDVQVSPSAYTVRGSPLKRMYLRSQSRTFKDADHGDKDALIMLAGQIAHEYCHLTRGPDEKTAYDFEIATLKKIGASKSVLDSAQDGKIAGLSLERR